MKAEIKLIDGTALPIDEFELNRIKSKIANSAHSSQVVITTSDAYGVDYIFPFSSVLCIRTTVETEQDQTADDQAEIADDHAAFIEGLSVDDLKEHLNIVTDAAAVQTIMALEQARTEPRKSALKLLDEKLKVLDVNNTLN